MQDNESFDMVRLTKAKKVCDVSDNTIRAYAKNGLRLYRVGKAVFFSRSELREYIRAMGTRPPLQEVA